MFDGRRTGSYSSALGEGAVGGGAELHLLSGLAHGYTAIRSNLTGCCGAVGCSVVHSRYMKTSVCGELLTDGVLSQAETFTPSPRLHCLPV